MTRLKEKYHSEVVPALLRLRGYNNVMRVPRLEKIVLNIGLGEATQNPRAQEAAKQDLAPMFFLRFEAWPYRMFRARICFWASPCRISGNLNETEWQNHIPQGRMRSDSRARGAVHRKARSMASMIP